MWGRPVKLYNTKFGLKVQNTEAIFDTFSDMYAREPDIREFTEEDTKATKVRAVKQLWYEGGLTAEVPRVVSNND